MSVWRKLGFHIIVSCVVVFAERYGTPSTPRYYLCYNAISEQTSDT